MGSARERAQRMRWDAPHLRTLGDVVDDGSAGAHNGPRADAAPGRDGSSGPDERPLPDDDPPREVASGPNLCVETDTNIMVDACRRIDDRVAGDDGINADDRRGADLSALLQLGAAKQDCTRVHQCGGAETKLQTTRPCLCAAVIVAKPHGEDVDAVKPSIRMIEFAFDAWRRAGAFRVRWHRSWFNEADPFPAGAPRNIGEHPAMGTGANDHQAPIHGGASLHRQFATITLHPTAA